MRTREQLAARLNELQTIMQGIVAANPVTVPKEEQDKFDAAMAEANAVKAEEAELVEAEKRSAANRAALAAIQPITTRTTQSQSVFAGSQADTANVTIKSEVMTAQEIVTRFSNCPERKPLDLTAKNGGFRTLGEQLQAIAQAGITNGRGEDPRLHWGNTTPQMAVSGSGASVPSDGGFLIQRDVANDFTSRLVTDGDVLSRVDTTDISANADRLTVNMVDETSRVTGSRWGGVQTYWGAEADTATAKKPKFRQMELTLKDIIGLAYVTDRLLMDANALQSIYTKAFAEEFTFVMEDGVFNGTGAGQMLGILNSNAKVSVTRTTASHVKYEDVVNMWARMYARSRKDAVWFINQDIEPDLYAMSLAIGTAGVPVYMPAGGLSGSQYATLYGKPVIATEYNASLGTVGDIVLADLGQYAMIRKGGLQSDSSIHVRFIYNESTFRWIYRTDGQPKWTTPVTPAKGSNTKSPFIVLAT